MLAFQSWGGQDFYPVFGVVRVVFRQSDLTVHHCSRD